MVESVSVVMMKSELGLGGVRFRVLLIHNTSTLCMVVGNMTNIWIKAVHGGGPHETHMDQSSHAWW